MPFDINGDGHLDLVTAGWFSKKMAWWQNPGPRGGVWQEHVIESTSPVDFAELADLDDDGQAQASTDTSACSIRSLTRWSGPNMSSITAAAPGGGLQMPVADLHGGDAPDLVAAGKSGLFL